MASMDADFLKNLGRSLREVRLKSGLSMDALGSKMGRKGRKSSGYLSRLERGRLPNVSLLTIIRYLNACDMPVERFLLAFVGGTLTQDTISTQGDSVNVAVSREARRKAAQVRAREKRKMKDAARKAERLRLWQEIEPIIRPYLVHPQTLRTEEYTSFTERLLHAAEGIGPALPDRATVLKAELDRVEGGLDGWFLNPEAAHRIRVAIEQEFLDAPGRS